MAKLASGLIALNRPLISYRIRLKLGIALIIIHIYYWPTDITSRSFESNGFIETFFTTLIEQIMDKRASWQRLREQYYY